MNDVLSAPREYNIKFSDQPQLIDEVSTVLIYMGYALNNGADTSLSVWKIKK